MYIQADNNGIKTTAEAGWRMIHNGATVFMLAELSCVTSTGASNELFVAATKAECEAEIAQLGLVKADNIK